MATAESAPAMGKAAEAPQDLTIVVISTTDMGNAPADASITRPMTRPSTAEGN
jgi:hypothetical protein